jgi:hypothetical protein
LIDIAHVRLDRVDRARHRGLHLCLPFSRQLRGRERSRQRPQQHSTRH